MERLVPAHTALLVVDVQEKLARVMPEAAVDRLVQNTLVLLEAARLLGVRVVATEQYPKGLGPTVAPLREKLGAMGVEPVDKLDFDALAEPRVAQALAAGPSRVQRVVVVGMEAHICVFQTARELARRGYGPQVVEDAVASRREENRQAGLHLCERAGAVRTVTETVVFDLLARAEGDAFKALSRMVK